MSRSETLHLIVFIPIKENISKIRITLHWKYSQKTKYKEMAVYFENSIAWLKNDYHIQIMKAFDTTSVFFVFRSTVSRKIYFNKIFKSQFEFFNALKDYFIF